MMYQGFFGAFPFAVSDYEVCTFRDFRQSRALQYAEHKTLDGLSRLQHTGRGLDPVSFTILVAPSGALSTVGLRLRALDEMARSGEEKPLVIGLKYHGLYILKSYDISRRQVHFGVTLSAEVAISLQEYN